MSERDGSRIIVDTCGGQSEVRIGTDGFIRKLRMDTAGDTVPGHTHDHHHLMVVKEGRVAIHTTTPDGTEEDHELGPEGILFVDKDVLHDVTALTDGARVWCIFTGGATR